jgi:uncharacterized membrane protein
MNQPTKKLPRELSSIVIIVASVIGLLDSIYLAYVKLFNAEIYCTPGLGRCDVVNASQWSTLWGIPLGIYGIFGFATLFLLASFGNKSKMLALYTEMLIFAISLVGFMFSLYLTYIEAFVLKAVCQWCVLSALMMTGILVTIAYKLVIKSAKLTNSGGN